MNLSYPIGSLVTCHATNKIVGCGNGKGEMRCCGNGMECNTTCPVGEADQHIVLSFAIEHNIPVNKARCSHCDSDQDAKTIREEGTCMMGS